MKYIISGPETPIQDTINIPSSKSISNRMLIIRSLAGSHAKLNNLSDSDDTRLLQKALKESLPIKDVGHAGTAMRFLAAYLSTTPGEIILTGSERMRQRPIGPLVSALRKLGAGIDFMETEGCPPLRIVGGTIGGGDIDIEAGISSQFISALMMIGPTLKGGLRITLTGEVVSAAYIEMTLALMNQCGADGAFDGKHIVVKERPYSMEEFTVESDWSGASYWYQVAALMPGSKIRLPALSVESLQGDAALVQIFEPLGVLSRFDGDGLFILSMQNDVTGTITLDFTACPDLVQTCAVTFCARGIPFRFTGTRTLRVKETDRIAALQTELRKVGFVLESDREGEWIGWDGTHCDPESDPVIRTFHDHRMAMAFAPLSILCKRITIDDPGVVTKSYPGYWNDLEKAGFGMGN